MSTGNAGTASTDIKADLGTRTLTFKVEAIVTYVAEHLDVKITNDPFFNVEEHARVKIRGMLDPDGICDYLSVKLVKPREQDSKAEDKGVGA